MDDHKLKVLLSAWFDGELDEATAAEVSAYVERSDEAKRIIDGFRNLQQLSDQSALNPDSDYWERAAAKIEAALPEAGGRITPAKRTGWSDWGWRAVSLAASLVLLTYVGFHSEDILDRIREPEPSETSESVIQRKAAEDESIQMLKPGVKRDKKDDADLQQPVKPRVKEEEAPPPEPPPKVVTESDRQRVEPVHLKEAADEEVKESAIEQTREYRIESPPSPSPERVKQLERQIVDSVSASAPAPIPPPPAVKIGKARTKEVTTASPEYEEGVITTTSDIDLAAKLPLPVLADSAKEPTREDRYQYLWDHVIVHKLTALQAVETQKYGFDGGGLSSGLTSKGKKSKAQSSSKRAKSDERAKDRERELIDAAFYVGSQPDNRKEMGKALEYLKYMAEENEGTLDKGYARRKYEELKDLR